jgi:hypothetical protein
MAGVKACGTGNLPILIPKLLSPNFGGRSFCKLTPNDSLFEQITGHTAGLSKDPNLLIQGIRADHQAMLAHQH